MTLYGGVPAPVASASEHATVLRNTWLIASGRVRNTVLHSVGVELVPAD